MPLVLPLLKKKRSWHLLVLPTTFSQKQWSLLTVSYYCGHWAWFTFHFVCFCSSVMNCSLFWVISGFPRHQLIVLVCVAMPVAAMGQDVLRLVTFQSLTFTMPCQTTESQSEVPQSKSVHCHCHTVYRMLCNKLRQMCKLLVSQLFGSVQFTKLYSKLLN